MDYVHDGDDSALALGRLSGSSLVPGVGVALAPFSRVFARSKVRFPGSMVACSSPDVVSDFDAQRRPALAPISAVLAAAPEAEASPGPVVAGPEQHTAAVSAGRDQAEALVATARTGWALLLTTALSERGAFAVPSDEFVQVTSEPSVPSALNIEFVPAARSTAHQGQSVAAPLESLRLRALAPPKP